MGSPTTQFDPQVFLAKIGAGRTIVTLKKKEQVYTQGQKCNGLFYIKQGRVKLTVLSDVGKEATIAILGPTDFFGEGCLAGQASRTGSATAMTECELMQVDIKSMSAALHGEHSLSDLFLAYLLGRNIRYEEDLIDHLFNSSEKRLARVLLLMAKFGKEREPKKVIPKISQEVLAEMVGTTRSRVSFFMNRFRKLGYIKYNGGLEIHSSLLNVILQDSP